MLRVAVVGLGDVSPAHLNAIAAAGAQLVAACDTNPLCAQCLPAGTAFYEDMEAMLAGEKPDCVHICLPHHLHLPAARLAAQHGCHVFCEKPPGISVREAEALAALEGEYGVLACLCLQNRWNPTVRVLRKELAGGAPGRVMGVRAFVTWQRLRPYYESKPWRGRMHEAGGGCLINQAIHTLDLMQHLIPSPVVRVSGLAGQMLGLATEVEDTAAAHMVYENGATGLFFASVGCSCDEDVQMDVYCTGGTYSLKGTQLYKTTDDGTELLAQDSPGAAGKAYYGASHVLLVRDFYSRIQTGEGEYIPLSEGVFPMKMLEAITRLGTAPAVFGPG